MFDIKLSDLTGHELCHLARIFAQIFSALSDHVFYQAYVQTISSDLYKKSIKKPEITNPRSLLSFFKPTRANPAAPINSSAQLAQTRPDIMINALSSQGHTGVMRSLIPQAENGLFIKGPVSLQKGQIISWYHGEIISEGDIDPESSQDYFMSLEGMASKNRQIIAAIKDPLHPGNAYYANHSIANNATFKTIYHEKLPVARVLIYSGEDCVLRQGGGERLEIVVNYGVQAAKQFHQISTDVPAYIPQIIKSPLHLQARTIAPQPKRKMKDEVSIDLLDDDIDMSKYKRLKRAVSHM